MCLTFVVRVGGWLGGLLELGNKEYASAESQTKTEESLHFLSFFVIFVGLVPTNNLFLNFSRPLWGPKHLRSSYFCELSLHTKYQSHSTSPSKLGVG